jgi:DNA-binding NarL/FixJ family response regulator
VWLLLSKGQSNKEIALNLDLTEGTVKQHVSALFMVLNIHSRSEAMLKAKEIWG